MSDFWKVYSKLAGIGAMLCIFALLLYLYGEHDQRSMDRQTGEVVNTLSKSLPDLNEDDRRSVIKDELLREREAQTGHEIVEHIAEALFLAGLMIICVEGFTHYAADRQETKRNETLTQLFLDKSKKLSEDTWQAVFDRLIPSEIADMIVDLLKCKVCRLRPIYVITLSNQNYVDVPAGRVVVTRELKYGLRNITGTQVPKHPIVIATRDTTVGEVTVEDRKGHKITLPRIHTVQIHHNPTFTVPFASRSFYRYEGDLPIMHRDQDAWMVQSNVQGMFLTTDRALYVLTQPCVGLEVVVLNEEPDLLDIGDIYLTNGEKLEEKEESTWVTNKGILSGTALSVSWRSRPTPENASAMHPAPTTVPQA